VYLDLVNSLQELKFATEDAAIKDEQFNAEISTVQSGLDKLFQFLVMRLDKLVQGVCPHEIVYSYNKNRLKTSFFLSASYFGLLKYEAPQ
jgi:hypothetical protein